MDAAERRAAAPTAWQPARVLEIRPETARVKTLRLALPLSSGHLAGQHYIVRLTAPDGYTAQRSYSVGSPPDHGNQIELTIERFPDGEVSTFLHDELMVGDVLDVRGPIGGWFVWNGASPALLIGGGAGIVPLMSMLRLARRQPDPPPIHLIASARSHDDLIYAGELVGDDVSVVYSRIAPAGWARPAGRLTADDIAPYVTADATTFICGSARFAGGATDLALAAGVDSASIRIERFGPTG